MKSYSFKVVDVFGEKRFSGNQLIVFKVEEDITEGEMQILAREFSFSEATFILSERERNGGFDVRIFTPEREVPFAGHPTLGTAYVIFQDILKGKRRKLVLNLKVGQIMVTMEEETGSSRVLWMKQKVPQFGETHTISTFARMLNLEESDFDENFPIQDVSTGITFTIVPMRSLRAVEKAYLDVQAYFNYISDRPAKALLLFTRETENVRNDFHVRVFAHYYGVPEDPATGSANGCLGGYLLQNNYFHGNRIDVKVEQGKEIQRPSLIFINAERVGKWIDVKVGGKVIGIAEGKLKSF